MLSVNFDCPVVRQNFSLWLLRMIVKLTYWSILYPDPCVLLLRIMRSKKLEGSGYEIAYWSKRKFTHITSLNRNYILSLVSKSKKCILSPVSCTRRKLINVFNSQIYFCSCMETFWSARAKEWLLALTKANSRNVSQQTLYGVQHIHINLTLIHSTFYRYADAD